MLPPPPPAPTALHQPHPELLWSRPIIVVKEQGPSRLKLYLRLYKYVQISDTDHFLFICTEG